MRSVGSLGKWVVAVQLTERQTRTTSALSRVTGLTQFTIFDFLGYRVVQAKALRTGHWAGKLFIPKGKLSDLRHKIKVMVKGIPTGCSLAEVISNLNPVIVGWGN